MKRFFLFLCAGLLLASCGVGSHTVVSGKADKAAVVFTAASAQTVEVTVDGDNYRVNTVKDSEFKKKRNIRDTAGNRIILKPGQHDITVRSKGAVVLMQKIFISAGDTKVIRL